MIFLLIFLGLCMLNLANKTRDIEEKMLNLDDRIQELEAVKQELESMERG